MDRMTTDPGQRKWNDWRIMNEWDAAMETEAAKGKVRGWYMGGVVTQEDSLTRRVAIEWRAEREKSEGGSS